MTFLRLDVLAVAFVLAFPVLAMGLRGDLTWPEVAVRLPWCLLAGWGAVALLRWASRPPAKRSTPRPTQSRPGATDGTEASDDPDAAAAMADAEATPAP